MLGPHFYNEAIRKTVIAFGTLFNNIELRKKNPEDNTVIESSKVPLAYGPKQKFLTRLEENPTTRKVAITLPRLYFELVDVSYDANRKTSSIRKTRASKAEDDATEVRVQYVPVPYDLTFELGIIAKSSDDGLQILEQILPFFTPEFTFSMTLVSSMGTKMDIPLVLNSVISEDTYEGDFASRRSIIWTLSFVMKSYLFPDVKDNSKVITNVTVDTHLMSDDISAEPEYLVAEDSSSYSTNNLILDSDPYDSSTRIRILTEDSDEESISGATISRTNVVPKDTTALTDETFGCSETFSFFPAGKTHDPVSGTDS